MIDASVLVLVLLVLLAAGVGGGLGAYASDRRRPPVPPPEPPPPTLVRLDPDEVAEVLAGVLGRAGSPDATRPPAPGGPCDHVWTGHPTEQNRNGYRIHKCLACGDELAVAGR